MTIPIYDALDYKFMRKHVFIYNWQNIEYFFEFLTELIPQANYYK